HAIGIDPRSPVAHNNWGNALAEQGKVAEAIPHYQQALQFKPDYADAHNNWGNALANQGKMAEAIPHYQQALQIRPDHASARANLLQAQLALALSKEDAAQSRKAEETKQRATR